MSKLTPVPTKGPRRVELFILARTHWGEDESWSSPGKSLVRKKVNCPCLGDPGKTKVIIFPRQVVNLSPKCTSSLQWQEKRPNSSLPKSQRAPPWLANPRQTQSQAKKMWTLSTYLFGSGCCIAAVKHTTNFDSRGWWFDSQLTLFLTPSSAFLNRSVGEVRYLWFSFEKGRVSCTAKLNVHRVHIKLCYYGCFSGLRLRAGSKRYFCQ